MNLDKYYQKRKRAETRRRFIFSVYLFLGGAFAVWGFFWISYFRISEVQVKDSYYFAGEENQIKNAISDLMTSKNKWFLPKNNFFIFSTKDAGEHLRKKNLGIAQVSKIFPDKIKVVFQESQPKFIFCGSDSCYYLNRSGVVSDKAPQFSENLLPLLVLNNPGEFITIGDVLFPKTSAEFLSAFTDGLKNINLIADKIEQSASEEFKIHIKDGWTIYLSLDSPADKIFGDFKLLLDQKIQKNIANLEYIDLRFPDKAFYKLR